MKKIDFEVVPSIAGGYFGFGRINPADFPNVLVQTKPILFGTEARTWETLESQAKEILTVLKNSHMLPPTFMLSISSSPMSSPKGLIIQGQNWENLIKYLQTKLCRNTTDRDMNSEESQDSITGYIPLIASTLIFSLPKSEEFQIGPEFTSWIVDICMEEIQAESPNNSNEIISKMLNSVILP
ncbi:hypothetical protein [Mesoterricola silvestris]|uniref:hypothetical protein n=1 Tax=Mesoterricola silvestris TaxID=2927979 RepID=UPI002931D847|nr:hypothetical protein [Mesoterricola silvestris]